MTATTSLGRALVCWLWTAIITIPTTHAAFVSTPRKIGWTCLASTADDDEDEEPKLILDNVEDQMQSLRSKFPTSEADYLAAARKRAEEARASVNSQASDKDWQDVASKKGAAADDGWEASLQEAGSSESQILIPMESSGEDGDDDEGEEPRLMLF